MKMIFRAPCLRNILQFKLELEDGGNITDIQVLNAFYETDNFFKPMS